MIDRRCCIAALEIPATIQQGSGRARRGLLDGLREVPGIGVATCATIRPSKQVATTIITKAILLDRIEPTLQRVETQPNQQSCTDAK